MLIRNILADHGAPLDRADADALGVAAAPEVERFLATREGHRGRPVELTAPASPPPLAREAA